MLALFSIAWHLGNWWLHDGLHAIAIGKLWATRGIEYGFHITLRLKWSC